MRFKSWGFFISAWVVLCLGNPERALAQAAGKKEETGNSSFRYEVTLSGGYLGFSTSSGQMSIAPSFYYKPLKTDLFQVGAEIGYQSTSHRGVSASNMAILGGVAVNIGNLSNAFYCMMGVALKSGSGGDFEDEETDDPNGFGYHFLCGKRLPIGGNPSWVFKPSVGVIAGGTGGMVFRPLAVSFLF
jgi:hypothetical protein